MAASRTPTMAGVATVLLVAAFVASGVSPQPTSGCTSALVSLSPCLNYITGNETTASGSCCSQLKTVVQDEPQCLCVALSSDSSSLGLNINRTRALALPDECKVETPSIDKCNTGGNAPGAAPTTPSAGTGSGGGGSKATPTAYLGSGGASLRGPVGLVVGFAAVAVYAVSAI